METLEYIIPDKILTTNFSDILHTTITASDLTKYFIDPKSKMIPILLNVIKSKPEYFNELEKNLSEILLKKLDINSTIYITKSIKDLYEVLYNLNIIDIKKGINISLCEFIFLFVINVILYENVHDEVNRIEILDSVKNILSTSIELITVRKVLKNNKINLFSCINHIYKK